MKLPSPPQRVTPSFAESVLDRALSEALSARRFGRSEIEQVVAFFELERPECSYCGSHNIRRWDHLVPVVEGGETVLGNMVLACAPCDDSKRDVPFEKWMRSSVPRSPSSRGIQDLEKRVRQIKKYVSHFGYSALPVENRISPSELKKFREIEGKIDVVCDAIRSLAKSFNERIQLERQSPPGDGQLRNDAR